MGGSWDAGERGWRRGTRVTGLDRGGDSAQKGRTGTCVHLGRAAYEWNCEHFKQTKREINNLPSDRSREISMGTEARLIAPEPPRF